MAEATVNVKININTRRIAIVAEELQAASARIEQRIAELDVSLRTPFDGVPLHSFRSDANGLCEFCLQQSEHPSHEGNDS